jgi:hypothetical protein
MTFSPGIVIGSGILVFIVSFPLQAIQSKHEIYDTPIAILISNNSLCEV